MSNTQLYKGDCLELMKGLPDKSIDLILTDPPYELNMIGGSGKNCFSERKLVKEKHIGFISNGFNYDLIFNDFLRLCKVPNMLIFCSNAQVSKIMGWFEEKGLYTTLLVWHKTNPIPLCNKTYLSDVEFVVYIRGKGATFNNDTPFEYKSKVYTSPIVSNAKRLHPTQKSVLHLMQYIKLHSKEGDTILDPFMGSGTTGVAAVKNNRNFIGYEINEEFFKIAEQRIENEKNTLTLF